MGRTAKSIKNISFGLLAQFITTIAAFITRTVMVKLLGIDAIALNGLFTEVIAVLSMAELGIGSTITYNLYKPLAENDVDKICRLMTFFKKVYRIIAVVTFGLGAAACVYIPAIVRDISYPDGYVRLIFMLFVIQISSSYLFSYKVSLLNADQNRYLISLVTAAAKIIGSVVLIGILLVSHNYVLYLIGNILVTVLTNVAASRVADKKYPYLQDMPLEKPERKAVFSNVRNIFIKQLSGKITNSTDNILISAMVSTIMVGYYSFYALVISVFRQLVDQIGNGISSSMGNLFATGSNEACMTALNRLTWMHSALATFCCVCIYGCMEAFITLWVGSAYLLPRQVLFMLCVNLYCYIAAQPIYTAMHMAGFFAEGRNISLLGSGVNLAVSILFGHYFGMFGIFLGTLCTYGIQIAMKIHYVYKLKFHCSPGRYAFMWGKSLALLLGLMAVCQLICGKILIANPYLDFVVKGLIGAALSIGGISLCGFRSAEFQYTLGLVRRLLARGTKKEGLKA